MPDPVMLGGPRMPDPVDVPLPALTHESFSWRLIGIGDDTSKKWVLRLTAAMQVGPNQFAPTSDHHSDYVFTTAHMLRIVELLVQHGDDATIAQIASLVRRSQVASVADTNGQPSDVGDPSAPDDVTAALEDAPDPEPDTPWRPELDPPDDEPRSMRKLPRVECGRQGEHEPHEWASSDPDGKRQHVFCEGSGDPTGATIV